MKIKQNFTMISMFRTLGRDNLKVVNTCLESCKFTNSAEAEPPFTYHAQRLFIVRKYSIKDVYKYLLNNFNELTMYTSFYATCDSFTNPGGLNLQLTLSPRYYYLPKLPKLPRNTGTTMKLPERPINACVVKDFCFFCPFLVVFYVKR